jgi:hypothetical protein
MSFYDNLIKLYIENINPPPNYIELSKVGGPISWYMADSQNNIITSIGNNNNYIIDLDITSAFPTICNCLYDNNSEFIIKLNNIQDKKEKNIFIATTLKGEPLKQINRICKLVITGIIFDSQDPEEKEKIDIFELKKDGCLLSCSRKTIDRLTSLSYQDSTFTQFILQNNFSFHMDYFAKYVRSNRTSFMLGKSLELKDFIIKGQYKHVPRKLLNIIHQIIVTNRYDIELINKVYSDLYFKILQVNNIKEYLLDYYIIESNKIINFEGKFVSFNINTKVDPNLYKKIFIYPMLITNTIN